MSDVDRRFHETWLGLVQPVDGLVVSLPVLVDAQCAERQTPHVQAELVRLCPPIRQGESGAEGHTIGSLAALFSDLLGFAGDAFDRESALPEELSLFVPEGRQTLRPSMALRKQAGPDYEMLVWEVPRGLDLDKPEAVTGSWEYPPTAKFDRLLRHCRVPIGLLSNGEAIRLVYAPHGESSGAITFRIEDMVSVGGRPVLDAFVMLLAANRFFGVTEERTLGSILAESRKRQANVTNDLADQVFEALSILLRGFEGAAERDGLNGPNLLDDAFARGGDHLYKGLLTVLLRLVFVLYAEDRGLLPVEHPFYARHLSVLGLFEQLQSDHGAYPDSMARRFGAWGRLVTVFRAIFLGVDHGDLHMPPRRGSLFNPHEYPFLEGWGPAGSAPITQAEDRAAVRLPTVDDGTVFQVLEKLLVFEGQRLSYRALDVEQIGSVYETLMGYHVVRVPSAAVCMKPDRLWVSSEEIADLPEGNRAAYMDAFMGNPPFAGKNAITVSSGEGYVEWLMAEHPDVLGKPNTDLSAYFFRRAARLIGLHGTVGLIATNTIAQGDSRLMSTKKLVDDGADIYAAHSSMPWPGAANVAVSVVHLAFGHARRGVQERVLDGRVVEAIDSRLAPGRERPEAAKLASNAELSFMGGKLVGVGLAVSLDEHDALVRSNRRNAEILRPYLGGEEVNKNPGGAFERYVIDFTAKSLEEARAWPDLMRIVEEKVRPTREKDKRGTYQTYWWRPGESGGALYAALGDMKQCLVSARVSKHLMFSLQQTQIFFSEQLYVFPLSAMSSFAVLQSRIHEAWARLLSSSLEDRLRYSASDCFDTFPFPTSDPRAVISMLEGVGQRLYDARASYMADQNVGLTGTYNRLKDAASADAGILQLRVIHEEMDRAVVAAYAESDAEGGWEDIVIPPFCPETDADKEQVSAFQDAVVDRLFGLNARRIAEETANRAPAGTKSSARAKTATPKRKRKKGEPKAQLEMGVPRQDGR